MQTSSPDSASPEHLQKMRCLVEEASAAAQRRLWAGSGLALAWLWPGSGTGQTGRFRFPLEVKSVSGCRKNAERRANWIAL